MSSLLPIGIFDSGIGGLTVASAIHALLPKEQILYFGDTKHLPYGDKSSKAIRYYSLKIASFLLEKKCKVIVIACHTASSHAYKTLVQFFGNRLPIVNVIDPVVSKIVTSHDYHKIGVIGTRLTIKSNLYAQKIAAINPNMQVFSLATPLLAPMIEEGFFNNRISTSVIHSYLLSPKLRKIDSLILACTHYPLIQPEIDSFYKGKVMIINSAEIVAADVKLRLEQLDLLSDGGNPHRFFVSDYTHAFQKSTSIFFGETVRLSYQNLFGINDELT